MKKILITWWLGYIGSHAVVEFEQAWYKTVIVDNLANSSLKALDWIEKILWYRPDFYKVDLLDKAGLEKVFQENDFDGVLHFAWLKAVWESCQKPILYFQNNITWSLNLFELMEKYGVKNIIFSSSATVYDLSKDIIGWYSDDVGGWNDLFEVVNWDVLLKRWLKETDQVWNTTNPYGRTKYILEEILKDLAEFSWFNVVSLRYFNPIWAHPSWLIWEDPNWIPNNLLPYIMKVYTWELEKLKVFGWDYSTKDGTWVRDYIDVVDLVKGHLKALKWLKSDEKIRWNQMKEWVFEIFNLGVGRGLSVLEMVKIVEEVGWKKIPYEIVERRPWDLAEVYCNPDKARKELDWEAKTSLEESIKNSWKFYNKK